MWGTVHLAYPGQIRLIGVTLCSMWADSWSDTPKDSSWVTHRVQKGVSRGAVIAGLMVFALFVGLLVFVAVFASW